MLNDLHIDLNVDDELGWMMCCEAQRRCEYHGRRKRKRRRIVNITHGNVIALGNKKNP